MRTYSNKNGKQQKCQKQNEKNGIDKKSFALFPLNSTESNNDVCSNKLFSIDK